MSLDSILRAQPRSAILGVAVVLIAVITWLDYQSGSDISLGVFHALPIILVVWYLGRAYGIATAAVCTLAWSWANKVGNPYYTTGPFVWATISRFVYFTCIAIGGAAIRKQRETDLARIAALERARALERDIVNVSEHEQRRIGQDIHDGLCQVLAGIGCSVSMLKDELQAKGLPEADDAKEIEGFIADAATEARDLARGIFPVLQDATGLESALEELANLAGKLHHRHVTVEYDDGIVFAKPEMAMHVYRIAQEALSNALKHGKSQNVRIALRRSDDRIVLSIDDDGCGIPSLPMSTASGGMGLRTMRYRASLIGGKLEIGPGRSGGTTVTCDMRAEDVIKPA